MQGTLRPRPPCAPRRTGAWGSSLVEVLVAILVLSVAVLGAAGVQLKAMKFGQVSQQRSMAVQHAAAIAEQMRANLAAASLAPSAYEFSFAYPEIPTKLKAITAPACTSACTADEVARRQLLDWQGQMAKGLTGGRGTIARTANSAGSPYVVTVMWLEKETQARKETVETQRSLNCPRTAPVDVQCVTLRFHP